MNKPHLTISVVILLLAMILSFWLGVKLSQCDSNVEITIEDPTQRSFYIDCLRLNKIDFALVDDGTILITSADAYRKLNDTDKDHRFYTAYNSRDLSICIPTS